MKFSGIVSLFGELVYFRRFAERVPDRKLARSTRILQWGATITFGLGMLFGIIAMLGLGVRGTANRTFTTTGGGVTTVTTTAPTPTRTITPVAVPRRGAAFGGLMAFLCVFAVAGFVFGIWYLVLLMRYRRIFAKAADEARALATGAADTPPQT